jgi:hypothetical protein
MVRFLLNPQIFRVVRQILQWHAICTVLFHDKVCVERHVELSSGDMAVGIVDPAAVNALASTEFQVRMSVNHFTAE